MDTQTIEQLYQQNKELIQEVNATVFNFHEIGLSEFKTTAYLKQQLKNIGFTLTKDALPELPTAFIAEYGSGSPRIAFLAEYDALPGYGENHDQNAHACGHSWIAANTFGACLLLKKIKEETDFKGTIVYMGCPAEETRGGKVDMVHAGVFQDIDMAMQIHIAGGTTTNLGSGFLAIDSLEFTFHGKSAHAAGRPWAGINALDACNLMFCGVNALRQHVKSDVRMHGIINNGGLAPNVVPALAKTKWYIRSKDRVYLNEVTEKVIHCAEGAALMTGTTMEYRNFENSYDDFTPDPVLIHCFEQALQKAEVENIDTSIKEHSGSSDLGNVSKVCPTAYCSFAAGNLDGSGCHEEAFLPWCRDEEGTNLKKAVLAQTYLALSVFESEQLQDYLRKRKAELTENIA